MSDENGKITQPMLETILEQMNARFEQMDARFDSLEHKIESEIRTLRAEMNSGFATIEKRMRGIEREITVLNKDGLKIRADQEHSFERVEELESKAS